MKITKISNRKTLYRAAAYCRVSTDKEEQQESFETQRQYYTDLIHANPEWEMAGIYADEGKSGTSAAHRLQFLKMIEDAENGKIDIILVKSISRFARNAAECQEYARELKTHGVEVQFEKEGISSMDPSADFIFSVLAVTAQEESRSIGGNVRWTYKKNFEKGIYHMGNNRILGYDMDAAGKLVPNDDAWIVKRAFEDYAYGMNLKETAEDLNAAGAHRLRSDRPFDSGAVRQILRNETYAGDLHLQKQAPMDYLTKKPMLNVAYTTYFVKNEHEGIVSREIWENVKKKMDAAEKDHENGIFRSGIYTHFLYGIVYCTQCGSPMIRRTYLNRKKENYKGWYCKGRQHKNGCTNPLIRETELLEKLEHAMEERGIPAEGDVKTAIVKNIRRVEVGPEEIKISFAEEMPGESEGAGHAYHAE